MRTEVVAVAAVIVGSVLAVRSFESVGESPAFDDRALSTNAETKASPAHPVTPLTPSRWRYEVRVKAALDHQFYVSADINRSAAQFLVDTGASYVALRDSDARKAGVYTAWTDYKYPVRTANGETKAALVTIDELEVDGIVVNGVKAFVLPDEQLAVNLLGMSFLSKIDSVEARAGELVLRG